MKSNHKAQMRGVKLIFSIIIIIILLVSFYIYAIGKMEKKAERGAEIISGEIEFRDFYSNLIQKQSTQITASNNKAEKAIEDFAKIQIALPKGGYSASCSTVGTDRECSLTITLHETLSTVLDWSILYSGVVTFGSIGMAGPISVPVTITLVALKLLAEEDIKEASYDAYLPTKGNAIKFTLNTAVEFG